MTDYACACTLLCCICLTPSLLLSTAEWEAWARSVERGSPAIVQLAVDPIWYLIRNATKAQLVQESVLSYAAQYNATWAPADPASYTMGWCDCYQLTEFQLLSNSDPDVFVDGCRDSAHAFLNAECREGFFSVQLQNDVDVGYDPPMAAWDACNYGGSGSGMKCCRPCFTVPQ